VNATERARRPGRLEIRADEGNLTPYAGLAVSGELVRQLGVIESIDAELAALTRVAPVKRRRRGVSAGALVVALAESQLIGGECFDDIEDVRADQAGAGLRAVAATPSASSARQLARLFRRSHLQAVERALAAAGERLDRSLGRDLSAPVTIDLDATEVEVYGNKKQGARRSRSGALAYAPYVATWAERGRALASELESGNRARLPAAESAKLCRRALKLLPAGHGEVSFRIDSGFYAVELLLALRAKRARFSVSCSRTSAMWQALAQIAEEDWQPAIEMAGAEVAETSYTPAGWRGEPLRLLARRCCFSAAELAKGSGKSRRLRTIPAEQLQLALGGELDSVYGYSFILTDKQGTAVELEHFHRQRAQIEERLKEAKLGQALRHLPSGNLNANRVWLQAALTALNLSAMLCDLSPALRAAGRPGSRPPEEDIDVNIDIDGEGKQADEQTANASARRPRKARRRRAAKTLRWLLFCVPARIARSGRRTILHLQAGLRHAHVFREAYDAAYALPPP
jgi:hypothetical protein